MQVQIGIMSWYNCYQYPNQVLFNNKQRKRCSMAFAGMLCLQIYYGLLLKEHLTRTQEKLEIDCLEHRCERSLKLCNLWSTQVSMTGEAGIVNAYNNSQNI